MTMETTMHAVLSVSIPRIAALLFLAVGAAAGVDAAPAKKEAPKAQFYPLPPSAPRVQYLATYASESDVKPARSSFADFLLGEKAPEALKRPYGAAMFEGRIYVADSRGPGLAVFDVAGQRYSFITGSGAGLMRQPFDLAIDQDGTKYVTDGTRNQVLVYDRADAFVAAYGSEGQFRPIGVAIAGDRLYVVDIAHHEVHVLDKRSGRELFKFGKPGSGEGELFHPTNVAVGPDGDVYVAETSNFRVSRFKPDGQFVRSYGKVGQTPGTFARPKGIAVDREGRLWVGDAAFQNVQVFGNDGRVLMAFGEPTPDGQGLNLPASVTIDYANVGAFASRADPKFKVEFLILVVSQFGPNKVDVFGYGRMAGVDYPPDPTPEGAPSR